MQNREELIKAFFSDEEKAQAIAKDEEFLNKVSAGEATPETYKEEFKKFGLDLTDEEATQVADMINKVQNTPDEKLPEVLNDLSLESVSGGGNPNDNAAIDYTHPHVSPTGAEMALWGALGVTVAGAITVFIGGMCEIAANDKSWDAWKAERRGDYKKAAEYYATAKKLSWMFPQSKADHDTKLKRLEQSY